MVIIINDTNMKQGELSLLFVNIPPRKIEDLLAAIHDEKLMVSLDHEISMPMGILYLSSYIKKFSKITNVGILDYLIRQKDIGKYKVLEDFVKDIALSDVQFDPNIICLSINFTTSHHFGLLCAKILSDIWPDSIIIIGGNHATNAYREFLKHSDIDYVIRGEGEIPLAKCINDFLEDPSADLSKIKGVFNEAKSKKLPTSEIANYIENLSTIPFPDWDLIDMEKYMSARGSTWEIGSKCPQKIACIISSRGCPYKCTFCSSHTVHGRKVRCRTIDDVVSEVWELYRRYGVNVFIPWDDMWTANRNRTLKLLKKLQSLNIPDFQIQYQNGLSVNGLDSEIIDELINTGMKMTAIAIESGSNYTQKHIIKKNCNLIKAREIVDYMKSKGICVRALFILGFPGETKALLNETISYAKTLKADWSVFSIASPLIGSEMYDQFVQMDCIKDEPSFWGESTFSQRSFDTPEIKADELNEIVYKANIECNFINNPNLISKNYDVALMLYNDIIAKFPFHVIAWYCIMECERLMGDTDSARFTYNHIIDLIKTNIVAKEMFLKYKDYMPIIYIESKDS